MKPIKKSMRGILSAFLAFIAVQSACLADFATPFVEINNQKGEVSESYGYLVAVDSDPGTNYLAIVTTDTLQHIVLHATARPRVVEPSDLGRWIRFEAQITQTGNADNPPRLEILRTSEAKKAHPWSKSSNGLQCRLGPVTQEAKPWNGNIRDLPISVTYELRNVGDVPVRFLPWFTPLETPLLSNVFHVENATGEGTGYVGILAKRMPPTREAFITIEAGQTVTNRVDLPYDFSNPGTYRISAPLSQPSPGNLHFYYGEDSPDIALNPDHVWTGTLESNEITVEIVPTRQ
ncbi:MAG: hypothetical protein GXY61_00540 [Lentisphaerae bacterium]|jgi:hypothetical protein|nr:hypothetical protein [Lentisphaerota bacterium]